jgi:hypothetical protein
MRSYSQEGANIRVYQSRRAMLRDMGTAGELWAIVGPITGTQLQGWYDKRTHTVYSLDDPEIVAHELRHHREGNFHKAFEIINP